MYELMVGICHGKALNKRYALIAEEIGDNKRVFELGCGTAMVYPFLHQGCAYEGWDLNDRFLAFAKKRGARNVLKRNVFDFNGYPDNDVILICDVLHHLVPLHTKLVQEALQRTKRLIVSEPARSSSKAWKMLKPLALAYHYMFGDYDGINDLG
jgi:SAM-dependent methyltransferase